MYDYTSTSTYIYIIIYIYSFILKDYICRIYMYYRLFIYIS